MHHNTRKVNGKEEKTFHLDTIGYALLQGLVRSILQAHVFWASLTSEISK
jgi:hypothetical protein